MNENENDDLLYLVDDSAKRTVKRITIQEYTIKTYDKGFIDGLRAFAYWNNGEQFVGTCEETLDRTIKHYQECGSYLPPSIKL